MARNPDDTVTHSRDLNQMIEQTQPAALRLLDDRALSALLRDLRAMKAAEADTGMQKTIAQAIRRAAADKRERQEPSAAPPPEPAAPLRKDGKGEQKRRKEAERAEKKRVNEAERAERKALKAAEREQIKSDKQALKVASQPRKKAAKAAKSQ